MIAWYEEEITQVPIRHPCEKWCPYEWGSKECFIRRGYEYDWHDRKWVRDEQGKPVIGKKQCDWKPKEEKMKLIDAEPDDVLINRLMEEKGDAE